MRFGLKRKAPANPWKALSLPAQLTGIRSMLSAEEKQYLTWLTATTFAGWGAIIDLGPWLGGSSAALAEGLKRQGVTARIHSLDLFKWEPSYMEAVVPAGLQEGDDFLPLFQREIGGYAQWIDAQAQDLMHYYWTGGAIEILFVDAAKTWELTNAILRAFGPYLIPGRSRVVLQDFRYHETHWLPLIFDSRPDLWQEVESVDDGSTVTFMPLKRLDGAAGIHPDYSEESFPLESAERLLRDRMARATPAHRRLYLRMLYRKYLIDGPLDAASKLRLQVVADKPTPHVLASIENVESILIPRGWRAYDREEFAASQQIAERCLAATAKRSAYALTLLGFSRLRLGDREGAKQSMDEVLRRFPLFPAARLFRAESALADGRHHDAEIEALDVLKSHRHDESTIDYALNVLSQIWRIQESSKSHAPALLALMNTHGHSPSFLAYVAQAQFKLGENTQALKNIDQALRLAPQHKLARELQATWQADNVVGGRQFGD